MRLTKFMGLAVVLVALAVTLNALAFSTAKVTNSATFTVAATGSAALAISSTPGTGLSADVTSNYLKLTVNDKMQPNSTYLFSNAITTTNKSSGAINLTGYSATANGVTVKLYKAGTNTELGAVGAQSLATANDSLTFDMEVTVDKAATTGAQTVDITINASQP
jgi:hypothetical protein